MDYIKYIIPIVTFLLGAGFTLLIKKKEKKDIILSKTSTEIAELATDWYEQLHDILIALEYCDSEEALKLSASYKHNRLILPKYLRALEILKKHKEADKLTSLIEKFLSEVTYENIFKVNKTLSCTRLPYKFNKQQLLCISVPEYTDVVSKATADSDSKYSFKYKKMNLSKLNNTLKNLDILVQEINKEAGRLI